jgi:hypothetical protein
MHSFASFAILAFSGRAVFMIRATGAKLRMLASDALSLCFLVLEARAVVSGEGDEEAWDMIGRVTAVAQSDFKRLRAEFNDWPIVEHARVIDAIVEAMPVKASFNMQQRRFSCARKSGRRYGK